MKKFIWFKFDPSAWMMGRIQREDDSCQVAFIRLCCRYWNKGGVFPIAEAKLECSNYYNILVEKRFITENDGLINIDFLDEQLDDCNAISEKCRKSVRTRWGNVLQPDTTVLRTNTTVLRTNTTLLRTDTDNIREEKKRRERNKKFIPPTEIEVIEYFKENGYKEEVAKRVFKSYSVADWHDTNGKAIKNWKQKVINVWFKDEHKSNTIQNEKVYPFALSLNNEREII
jgi:hypothetical protein